MPGKESIPATGYALPWPIRTISEILRVIMGRNDQAIMVCTRQWEIARRAALAMFTAAAAASLAVGGGGCGSTPEPAVVARPVGDVAAVGPFAASPNHWRARLADDEQAEVHRVLRSIAAGAEPVNPPRPADHPRWGDVPLALGLACERLEIAVVTVSHNTDEWQCSLRTINARPGRFVIRRDAKRGPYAIDVSIGWFPDENNSLESRLIDTFEATWQELAEVPRFDNPFD